MRQRQTFISYRTLVPSFDDLVKELAKYGAGECIGIQSAFIHVARAQGVNVSDPGSKQFLANLALAALQFFRGVK